MSDNYISSILKKAKQRGTSDAMGFRDGNNNTWQFYSWQQLEEKSKRTGAALISLGLKRKENVGIFSQNHPYWSIADLGIMNTGSVSVPIYATNTADQADYIIRETGMRFLFVGDREQYDKALEIYSRENSTLEKLILLNDKVETDHEGTIYFSDFLNSAAEENLKSFDERLNQIDEEDLATIIYTSGTTGEPKGVMLTHKNFNVAFRIHDIRFKLFGEDHSLAFLPLSHIFERAWTLYALYRGVKVSFLEDPKQISTTLAEVKPSVMCSVPRLYQKAYHAIHAKSEQASKFKQKLFNSAIENGRYYVRLKKEGKKVPWNVKIAHVFYDKLVFAKIRKAFGGNLRFMPCAGAPLSAQITEFFHAVGMPILIGYGLTETCATVSVFPSENFKFGTVGTVMPDVEVKIGPENEIWVRGETIMKGYYKKPEETARVFEGDWFKTGDAGSIDEDEHLSITDRIKDLMKTSYGKYVAPQPIEAMLTNDNFIENAVLIGDDKPYISALLVPNFEALKELAHSWNITYQSWDDLVIKKRIIEFYEEKLDQLQDSLAGFEKVKKFKLLSEDFKMQMGELTPTLKVKRQTVMAHFSHLIDDMYSYG